MAQSVFSYRGGARSGSVSGQPTGLGGAPIGRAGQTFGQALRLQMQRPQQGPMVATGEQSGFATPQPKPAPTPATPAPAQGAQRMMPQPARAALGVTTPMFMPSFRLPNTAFSRYMQSQMTAPQRAVQNTPVMPTIPGGAYGIKSQEGTGSDPYRDGTKYEPVNGNTNVVRHKATGAILVQQGDGSWKPLQDVVEQEQNAVAPPSAGTPGSGSYATKPTGSVTVNADGTVTVDGQVISDPFAKTEEQLQSQRMIDEAEQRAQNINKRAQEQIDADQILKALAAAGAQGVRGGMSGFGLGEQGEILRAANAAKLQAESVLQGSLASLAAQTAANEQASYERVQALHDMNSPEGQKAFQRTQRMSDIAQQIAALQQGGLTDEETAQVQTLAEEYAGLKAANEAAVAKQTGSDDDKVTSDKYDGDLESSVNVTEDQTAQDEKVEELTNGTIRYLNSLRSQYGSDLGDEESVLQARGYLIKLANAASKGDPVAQQVLANIGLDSLPNAIGQAADPRFANDLIDYAMDRLWDTLKNTGTEFESVNQGINAPPTLGGYYYEKPAGSVAPSADGT